MRVYETTEKGELAKEYLRKYPDDPTRTIAMRMMSTEQGKAAFTDLEHARSLLRYYRGATGASNRERLADRSFFMENLPRSKKTAIKHYTVPQANKNILLLPDVHIPYHDERALSLAINYGVTHDVDTVIINGDFIDFYAISRFDKDPQQVKLIDELYQARDVLYSIRETFPNALIIFKHGNHENRWSGLLDRNILSEVEEMKLRSILHFNDLGIIEVEDRATIWAGKLAILHGHEHKYGMIAPVNPARGLFLRTKQSALMSHVHRVSEHTEKSHDGKLIGCWSTGCLCQLDPDYSPYNNFGHGFAHVVIEQDGNFTVLNKKIIDGKIY